MKQIGFKIALILAVTIPACSKKTPVNPVNASPVISALFADSTLLSVTSQTPVRCIAHDPEGDTLQYDWQSYPGAVTGSGAVISWQAPEVGGNYPLICRVRDSHGNTAEARIRFSVVGNASPVYQVLLDGIHDMWYAPQYNIVVLDSTTATGRSYFAASDYRESLFSRSDEILLSTYEDYLAKNQTPIRLSNYPFWNAKHTLYSTNELRKTFGGEKNWMWNWDGWENFYESYPNTRALLWLSKIGFNHERNQALIYVLQLYRAFGYAYFFILSRSHNKWEVTRCVGLFHADY